MPSPTTPHLTAVVVNYNAGDHLIKCVRSPHAAGVDDVVVADNSSRDGSTEAAVAAEPSVRVVATGGNFGYGGGVNRGVAGADESTTTPFSS